MKNSEGAPSLSRFVRQGADFDARRLIAKTLGARSRKRNDFLRFKPEHCPSGDGGQREPNRVSVSLSLYRLCLSEERKKKSLSLRLCLHPDRYSILWGLHWIRPSTQSREVGKEDIDVPITGASN